jgi:hypothetical protein
MTTAAASATSKRIGSASGKTGSRTVEVNRKMMIAMD